VQVPAYVDALVLRATARDREHRPADAKVFLQQLRRVRGALEAGDTDDAELTADLLPVVPAVATGIDYTDEPTTVIGPVVEPVISNVSGGGLPAAASGAPTMPRPRTTPARPAAAAPPPGSQPARRGPGGAATNRPSDRSRPAGAGPAGARPAGSHPAGAPRSRRSRRGPLLLLMVVLLTALVAYAGWWFGIGRYTTTPGVTTLSVAAATERLDDAGLELEVVDKAYSETVPAGSVISTDPTAGSRILEGGTVEAVVSLGRERYEVPKLAGEPFEEVEQLLEDSNLTLGDVTRRYHEKVPKGVVIAADPRAGTELQRGRSVNVSVSKGPEPIRIPDSTGKDAEEARSTLEQLGFEVRTTEEHSDDVERGDVISQDPDGGKGFRGDVVDLVVSKGPVLVEVPNVRTLSVEEATAALEAAGLKIAVERTELFVGLDRVVKQSVDDGEAIPKGSTVTVSIV
jgi:serine/threonine-protein kinase